MTDHLYKRIEHAIGAMPWGWCTIDKALAMAESILETKPVQCVEIGVYGGKSLIPCALALSELKHGHILGIDPWLPEAAAEGESDEANKEWWTNKSHLELAEAQARNAIDSLGLEHVCNVAKNRSENIAPRFKDGSIGFLHIDGNHTELASVRDTTAWLPKMEPGGLIWFDDINWATTHKALSILDESCDLMKDLVVSHIACRLYRVKPVLTFESVLQFGQEQMA